MGNFLPSSADNFPSFVRSALREMPSKQFNEFYDEYNKRARSLAVAYLAHVLLFAPYGYLEKWVWQILFWITCGGSGIWWLLMIFVLPSMVQQHNNDIAVKILQDIKTV